MTSRPDVVSPGTPGSGIGVVNIAAGGASSQLNSVTPVRGSMARRTGAAARRRARQREIVLATRALFDAREMREANIDDIARSVGVNRAIIYRHFASKEELFALVLAQYLDELGGGLRGTDDPTLAARARLTAIAGAYADFCLQYPAFLDCALALLRQSGTYLLSELSDSSLQLLGQRMVGCLSIITDVLRAGTTSGDLQVEDVDLTANMIYLQTLGFLHLARNGFIVRDAGDQQPEIRAVGADQFRALVIRAVLAAAQG